MLRNEAQFGFFVGNEAAQKEIGEKSNRDILSHS